ncbi:MAG: glycosyltransferase family 4 protein [Clostridia bacterium]|nr:glycosyltransferase family 4 protein [Clostridia bacterium]
MKRLLYIAFKDFSNLHFGANAKVLSQCRAFEKFGYEVDMICRQGSKTVLIKNSEAPRVISEHGDFINNKLVKSVTSKQRQIRDIISFVKDKQYDACYVRYDFSDSGFIKLLKALKGRCGKIALELPTYPYEDENKYGILSKMKMQVDFFYRKKLHKYIDFIVTFYAGYEELFGIPVIVVPNGFDFSTMQLAQAQLPQDAVHIVAVSSMREWHGYERFIEGLHNYYSEGKPGKKNFILHLVGNGREYGKYKELVEKYGLEAHVVMEGAMHGEKLDELYEKCALGIDSLARHRSGIDVLSSLKSREYGAKGIPMINSCKIDIIGEDFPYLLRVPADESPIDIDAVAEFYDKCCGSGKSRLEIGREIRSYIEQRSSMENVMLQVAEKFEK